MALAGSNKTFWFSESQLVEFAKLLELKKQSGSAVMRELIKKELGEYDNGKT